MTILWLDKPQLVFHCLRMNNGISKSSIRIAGAEHLLFVAVIVEVQLL